MLNGLKIELLPCPCCGGEARLRTYRVEDGYVGYTAGDVGCTECGLRTRSAPVDGTFGLNWTEQEFADLWNRRTDSDVVGLSASLSTDEQLDALAERMGRAIVSIADTLPVVDEIHESLARVMASRMIDMVISEIDLRSRTKERTPDA